MTNSDSGMRANRTKTEERLEELLGGTTESLPIIKTGAWYFTANFGDVLNGTPIGRLVRYDAGDRLLRPSAEVAIPGVVHGSVVFRNGRAMFDGNGYLTFTVTENQINTLEKAKLDMSLTAPQPLLMIGRGQIDDTREGADPYANPVLHYSNGGAAFGFWAPKGTMASRVNLEEVRTSYGLSPEGMTPAMWYAHVETTYASVVDGRRYRFAHKLVDVDSLDPVVKREFFLYDKFEVALDAGATFSVGAAPDKSPKFAGWLEEVIFDPMGGSGSPGGGGGT